MRKLASILCLFLVFYSCDEDVHIAFEDTLIETEDNAKISIDIPKAVGTAEVANKINHVIETHVANQTNMANEPTRDISLKDAIEKFNTEYVNFKSDFPESSQQWEALIDGEVLYQTSEIISIAINSYLDTGGAHGNTVVRFLNFDAQTGSQLTIEDLITDLKSFKEVVEKVFKIETNTKAQEETMEDFFFGDEFQLPESIGYSDEGVIVLYNTYEMAAYAQGITEFTIPFGEVERYLKIR